MARQNIRYLIPPKNTNEKMLNYIKINLIVLKTLLMSIKNFIDDKLNYILC